MYSFKDRYNQEFNRRQSIPILELHKNIVSDLVKTWCLLQAPFTDSSCNKSSTYKLKKCFVFNPVELITKNDILGVQNK